MIRTSHWLVLCLCLGQTLHTWADTEPLQQKAVKDVIPLTIANLKGQQSLYQDGWFIITSSSKALNYAKQHSIDSSSRALKKLKDSVQNRSVEYAQAMKSDVNTAGNTTQKLLKEGTQNTQKIFVGTHASAQFEWQYSQEAAKQAWQSLVTGYVYLGQSTYASIEGLKAVPSGYSDGVRDDFNELFSSYKSLRDASQSNIKSHWDSALSDAETNFKAAYQDSGEASNSLSGLWTLLSGYAMGAYHGLFKPSATSSWQVAKYSAVVAGEVVFLPVASTYILTKNTVRSAGLAVYYTGKTAIEVVAPTLKGGFLAGMSLLSAGAVPITYISGSTVGVINQVGTLVAAPVVGVTQGVVSTTADTLMYGALVTYDAVKGTTKVFVNQVKSGVVLGYNALTAIPSQLLLGTVNSAVFLFWDGPRLTIATLKGEVNYKGQNLQPGALPVGSVIDLKALQKSNPDALKIITDDPDVIQQVLESLPKDLRKP
jgi:hypothetical protein